MELEARCFPPVMTMDSRPMVSPSIKVFVRAFVRTYYSLLHRSPNLVIKMYKEGSTRSRPDPHGRMTSATTLRAIAETIQAIDYTRFKAKIKTVDSENTAGGAISVLVTGILTSNDNITRNFTQSFVLAPQETGYYLATDILRYTKQYQNQHRNTFNCPVCLNKLVRASSTVCGHIFCQSCIMFAIKTHEKCPLCNKKLAMNDIHRVYLPSADE